METDVTFEPWSSKRTTILGTYTTSERIPITTVITDYLCSTILHTHTPSHTHTHTHPHTHTHTHPHTHTHTHPNTHTSSHFSCVEFSIQ